MNPQKRALFFSVSGAEESRRLINELIRYNFALYIGGNLYERALQQALPSVQWTEWDPKQGVGGFDMLVLELPKFTSPTSSDRLWSDVESVMRVPEVALLFEGMQHCAHLTIVTDMGQYAGVVSGLQSHDRPGELAELHKFGLLQNALACYRRWLEEASNYLRHRRKQEED